MGFGDSFAAVKNANTNRRNQIASERLEADRLALVARQIALSEALDPRRVAVDEGQLAIQQAFAGPEIMRIGATTRVLEAEAKQRDAETEALRNPFGAIEDMLTGLARMAGVDVATFMGGGATGEVQGPPAPPAGSAMGAAMQALNLSPLGSPVPSPLGFAAGPSTNPVGALAGSPILSLGVAMEGLGLSAREQVMDAFKAQVDQAKASVSNLAGASSLDISVMLHKATNAAADAALGLARQIKTKYDADRAWLSKNRGYLSRFFPGLTLPGSDDELYQMLGPEKVGQLRSQKAWNDAEAAFPIGPRNL